MTISAFAKLAAQSASEEQDNPLRADAQDGDAYAQARRQIGRSLKRLGLEDARQALLCLPVGYVDCRQPERMLPREEDGDRRLYLLTLRGNFVGYTSRRDCVGNFGEDGWVPKKVAACKGGRCEIEMHDAAGNVVTWNQFGGAWQAKKQFGESSSGDPVVLTGRMSYMGRRRILENVETVPARAIGRVWTRYGGIQGRVPGGDVEQLVLAQLDNPEAYRLCAARLVGATGMTDEQALEAVNRPGEDHGFRSFEHLLRALHMPASPEQGYAARGVCNRLSALAIQASALRHHDRPAHPQAPLALDLADLDVIAATQAETLTPEQRVASQGIARAMTGPKPLTGLLVGDVGTGKTLAYLLPVVAAHRTGARCAIIAPTDLLADQIALQVVTRFGPMGVRVERVPTGARKISDPGAILVSTHGLTGTAKRLKYVPQVLVCDEQHKMAAAVREVLVAPWTHVLEASATPIPRTLATALYDGMQVFKLHKPPVAKTIHSIVYDVKDRPKGAALLRWVIDNGMKAAVVYPRIDPVKLPEGQPLTVESAQAQDEVQSVLTAAKALEQAFPGKVAVLHGRLSDDEKQLAMGAVRSGQRPILVASTVLETGIDIPAMAGMIVRDADRFGASQLHQLRGRLARNGGEAWFMMMVQDLEVLPPSALERLESVAATNDGFELAELDLMQRGFGDLDGTDQTGAADTVFRLVKLRPEDFLRHKLKGLQQQSASERASDRARDVAQVDDAIDRQVQPRLFA
jgi:ATP-dependent DNA helicase RecG